MRPTTDGSTEDDEDPLLENAPSSATTFTKEPSILEQKAYRDTWGKGLDSYLKWFYETAVLLRELLSEKGSIYVHLDENVAHYAKCILDEVFGNDNFIREIVWSLGTVSGFKAIAKNWTRSHDVIFYYSKSSSRDFNKQFVTHKKEYVARFDKQDEAGRLYRDDRPGARRQYLDESQGRQIGDVWDDIMSFQQAATSYELVGYPTQKPEALLTRIIEASSNPGDLVLYCFCGSGTTAATAEKLGRRWITCDLGRFAIHTARKRLLAIPNVKPFIVQNLGKYERQHWQIAEFGDAQTALTRETAYRAFILDLYRARPLSGYVYLHGVKGNRRVFVGGVDSPVSLGDLKNIGIELKKTVGTGDDAPTTLGVDILGWDFAFDLNETGKAAMQDAGIDARFIRIPREVLERKAVEQGDIKFFELAALQTDVQSTGKTVTVTLADFVMPTDDVPQEVQTAITHWSQWIDYWAVDWDNKGDTFHNEWQDYRTRKKRDLQYRITHPYKEAGTYQIVIKVIDILGNDTTKTVNVSVS